MPSNADIRVSTALLVFRFFLGIFLLQWSIEKLILPESAVRIAQGFYGLTLPTETVYVLGMAEVVLSFALLFGAFRTISYALSLFVHTVTVMVSWRQLFDLFGLAKIGGHLWISTWPTGADLLPCSSCAAWMRGRLTDGRNGGRHIRRRRLGGAPRRTHDRSFHRPR